MRKSLFGYGLFGAALGAALLFAAPRDAAAQACENPKVLRFSIIPTQESVREITLYKPVLDLLSKNTGKKIEFYMPTSYSPRTTRRRTVSRRPAPASSRS
jgi:phosphonate transport system substrate-binding protein